MKKHLNIISLTNKLEKINYLRVEKDKNLAEFSSFKVGGPADLFLVPQKIEALQELMPLLIKSDLPYFILGRGSNLIISDKGYQGIIIYTAALNNYQINNNIITAQSGLELKEIADLAYENSLSGFEFAAGIPGSLGGALYMNAGAYGGEMKDVIIKAKFVNQTGKLIDLNKSELNLDYRTSILQKENPDWVAVSVTLKLQKAEQKIIKAKMDELHQKRWSKQPMELPSAGSIFKRPPGHYTGPLIEEAGLKGYQIGGAQVSTKHAGFIVNKGSATAEDIINLINKIKEEVYKISGVQLEVEPRFLGEF
ncbi:MAG: UDP-N-acetylmuramate dehydrogenase [Halanaerobium sp. 4-GBenrich]|jgi:UDP-N-acetylmuramate dehydrogenase|uniref:UDP-N-acetylenolpyruvoylglucosamine reductase n=1 Tax=Halanaerobium congolense TaxID=54121 RepID=A0A1G8MFQ7_9FIRM|nr:UDP-N-acetylmuramate dehydrogenase [Halanaerobium congolense]KXS48771.1 MAG: UDP-N-acetylmuramate dehydrogenase [Halanaerobium sp. T82-1]ODS50219.1 MAG: UDP-N-acetylmuramate dehydrogenase [Halanaerobium sp. 4-GBenrich]OEG63542.1 MAG: UDP-N-acetylenolpyruvoylglucosamine reductase [Halanaerobium sp. MDAL1]PUU91770.1 MAG: UDP-N-acetylmuramate dehydrogenase [Halanaerobium sp.]PXV68668.1 UDP-N-acetylmuramate dehydrogenase [Halanaerobium congolense]